MKILTNENNTATLKLLIAANLAGKKVELQNVSFEGVFAGPRSLPQLEVDDQLSFFSSNAAAQYLFPVLDMSQNGQRYAKIAGVFAGPRSLPQLEVDDQLSFFSSNAAAQYLFPVLDMSQNGQRYAKIAGVFAGPRSLPQLEVDDQLSFFSSNAAAQYLFPVLDMSQNGQRFAKIAGVFAGPRSLPQLEVDDQLSFFSSNAAAQYLFPVLDMSQNGQRYAKIAGVFAGPRSLPQLEVDDQLSFFSSNAAAQYLFPVLDMSQNGQRYAKIAGVFAGPRSLPQLEVDDQLSFFSSNAAAQYLFPVLDMSQNGQRYAKIAGVFAGPRSLPQLEVDDQLSFFSSNAAAQYLFPVLDMSQNGQRFAKIAGVFAGPRSLPQLEVDDQLSFFSSNAAAQYLFPVLDMSQNGQRYAKIAGVFAGPRSLPQLEVDDQLSFFSSNAAAQYLFPVLDMSQNGQRYAKIAGVFAGPRSLPQLEVDDQLSFFSSNAAAQYLFPVLDMSQNGQRYAKIAGVFAGPRSLPQLEVDDQLSFFSSNAAAQYLFPVLDMSQNGQRYAKIAGVFAGPRSLPQLEVDDQLSFFSSNAAAQYLFPVLDMSQNGQRYAKIAGVFAGPRSLPQLEVDDQLSFFSSNAAAQYLFPVLDMSQNGQRYAKIAGVFAGPRSLPQLEVDDQLSFFSSNAAAQYLFPVLDMSQNGQRYAKIAGVFAGPRSLPQLEVDDQLSFFSSNAAAEYLFPVLDMSQNGQSQQMQEWEATRLQPAVSAVLSAKTVPADLKQVLDALLQHVEALVANKKYLFGDMLSSADISLWSTLYPLYHTEALKSFLTPHTHILRWYGDIAQAKAVQEAVSQWGGSVARPFAPLSALGAPQLPSLGSPVGTPMDGPAVVPGPSADEITNAKDSWEHGCSRLQAPLTQERFAMPMKDRKNVLITSSLPYVNNVPHLGNIIGCVLSGDIFARYCRLCDYNTLYICGTDEYGTATETKALQEGVTPQEICDKYYDIHNAVYRWFDIGFDHFGRTSTPEHTQCVQKLFLQVKHNGFINSQTVDQLHCEKCVKFLADRFVEGTCPHPGCLYEDARGDQCDKCGKLVNAIELINPRCKICGNKPAVRPSEQLFIELAQLEPSLRSWWTKVENGWSPSARAVTRSWLREPLRARAVTRDLKWGVPVPVDGFRNKVFYVWFDAPVGYWSITQCLTKDYEKWWKPDKDINVKLYQFMAKDNVPFHAIMFPTAIIAANQGHVLVDHIFATEYLNYEEGKFSKSRGVGVFGTDAQDTGIPSDVWRFYLASVRPESSDSSFSWLELGTRNNSELLNNLGNFCHRSLSFCANSFKGKVPELKATAADFELMALVNRDIVAYVQHMEKGRLREALKHVLLISKLGNQHMQASQPWVLLKGTDDDKERGGTAIAMCCQLVTLLCALISPYMPATGRKLRSQLNISPDALRLNPKNPSFIQYLPAGHQIGKPEPLFTKIEPEVLEKLKAKYAGTQDDREKKLNGEITSKATGSVSELEKAVAEQGEKVRALKASTKDKAVWAPEVNKLLELKKQLTAAQQLTQAPPSGSVADLEKAVAEQGDKVRQLKSSTKDKAVWAPEVNKLLELKKQLTAAQATPTSGDSVASLEKAITEQGDKVRKLKASTKDKSVWTPEVNILLDLKKRLSALQTK